MKNIYRVTRPAWAAMESLETRMIFVAGAAIGVIGMGGDYADKQFGSHSVFIKLLLILAELSVPAFGCLALISFYKKRRVGCYPSTFVYCFNMPAPSNPGGKSQVVGYCHFRPNMENGEVIAKGASFFWEDGLDVGSRVGFRSTHVRGTDEDGEITCHIRFKIDADDSSKRLYRYGLLRFRPAYSGWDASDKEEEGRTYAGYLQSMRNDSEIQDVEVQSKGLALWWCKGNLPEGDVQSVLRKNGEVLFAKLKWMSNAIPLPTIWQTKDHMQSQKTNVWGNEIPTPQSVILNENLRPHIDAFLNKVLALYGLPPESITAFRRYARTRAAAEKIVRSYEVELKTALVSPVVDSQKDEALTDRARVICGQITPFLEGKSLLDIGCGNGMISNSVKNRFTEIQLLDVVKYVPQALNLPFKPYKEGEPLPITGSFDTVLLLTVLHHSNDPVELLRLAWAATKKRLIIIESVVGVHKQEPGAKYALLGSSDEDQIAYATFVDWFYNRVLHNEVPVPYNFTTPEKWKSVFLENNMHLSQAIHLGQDIEIGPEYHILFVLEKPAEVQQSSAA